MTNYKHILWDWNGTLLDDVDECIEIINTSLIRRQLKPIDRNEYLEKFQFPVRKYYEEVGFDFSRESFEEAGKEYIRAYAKKMFECRLHDSAREVLQSISEAGRQQYILSALNDEALQKCVKSFGLKDFFAEIRGLDDHYAHSKVELGQTLLKDLGIDPATAVMIGDTIHDFEVAQAMGIGCILVAAGHNSRQRLESCDAKVIDNLGELKGRLNQMI